MSEGCGSRITMGHGDVAVCGKPYWDGIYICDACRANEAERRYKELIARPVAAKKPQMTSFLLFGGVHYYPVGGWNDFIFAGSLEECRAKFSSWKDYMVTATYPDGLPLDWAHIVDLSTQQKILTADWNADGTVTWRTPTDADM